MEEIGIIEEIASGHEKDIKLFGFTIFPKTDGWLGIHKLYDNSSIWNRFKYKQLGTYHTPDYNNYKTGDKVKVEIQDKKIVNVEVMGHLSGLEHLTHKPIALLLITGIFIIVILAILDIHVRL